VSPSFRAQVITRRTYNRPLDDTGAVFETWAETIDRVVSHQRWLWSRAKGKPLSFSEETELAELRQLMLQRKALPSGRTLWLGGTEVAKRREASQFNCSFERTETVHDVVDGFWLLLQGCGLGANAVVGNLNGFTRPVEIETVRSALTLADWNKGFRGAAGNTEEFYEWGGKLRWHLTVGDSAEAWAKSVGKILAMKRPVDVVVLDFSQVRAAGTRLKGYGWISSGDETLCKALVAICGILNTAAGRLLTSEEINDIINWLGTTLSSRRAAEILTHTYGAPLWREFATRKKDHWNTGNPQRGMSNNSLVFYQKPSKADLNDIFQLMQDAGGSEPGFINGAAALKRAPWFKGVNPCCEILLGNKSFCNLVETDLGKFNGDFEGLKRAIYIIARANYRQTCVNLDDGVLQRGWHELNEFLRLTGVGLTGIVMWEHVENDKAFQALRFMARMGVQSMATELGTPMSKAVTTVKPSGTLGKIMDTTEGVHKPLGKYIFNNVGFSVNDPLVERLREAGYRTFENPYDPTGVLVTLPVSYESARFDVVDGREVNLESAVSQLERYKRLMRNYVDHNCSITVSYDPSEVPEIVEWIHENWDDYVGVSFLYRNDPTKTAADLGYPYLPQEVVTRETFEAYTATLAVIDVEAANALDSELDDGCATGACPIR